ncbi:ribonuclease R [Amphiplicatus metriothermophilus]|uniref:Ribonuclease R n=1 Tax=Amphiplicatus metriothermophilus TaxID=1519374 RepID=A0A239PXT6_9PROT|nr:ribonuclease R [Amphiplicatus metriothermophilus]MBB5520009.1 ribonuclease R [Amphiplicatus metriothermophilus]SNT74908.1 RNAse R [Amphiplicatus metriothermophilus]
MAKRSQSSSLPTKQEILDYLDAHPGEAARRDIARAFGVKGAQRTALRALLKEMERAGELRRAGARRVAPADRLPPVTPVDIMSVDEDGDMLCLPVGWKGDGKPPLIRLSARAAAKIRPAPGVGDRFLARLRPAGDEGYGAQFVKALGKGAHRFLAVYRANRHGGVAEPVERRARNVFTIDKGDAAGASDGDLVWVETKHARGYGPARARVREIAGHVEDRGAYSLIALANHGIPIDFPEEALKEAERARPPAAQGRLDLRDTPLLTIDPEDAKDHDDAVWAAPDDDPANEGGYKVIVAIADVSWFVRPGGALDREALRRGNSVYLPDRVVPMLPERLSNDLCSLREGEDRPCLAVEMTVDAKGRKRAHRFHRAIMRSAAKLSYGDAQAIIEGGQAPAAVMATVRHLHAAFRARWEERKRRAPLDLDLPERRIVLGPDGAVARVERRERFDAHRVIEEFMILANVAAAETLEQRRTALIYRVHDSPDPEKLEALRDYLASLDYSFVNSPAVRPSHFNQILRKAEARDQKEMVSEAILRSQKQAVYATENLGHFGLNLPRYAHFTSPIRRYADLTVHRGLVAACKLGAGGQTPQEAAALSDIAEKISDFERRAVAAERESRDRYLAGYLAGRVGAEFDARITGVTRFGVFVALDETGADGFTPMRALGFERFRFDEKSHAVVGETTGGRYRLGQTVRVRLAEATPLTGGLRFEMLSDPLPPDAGAKSRRRRAPGGKSDGKSKMRRRSGKKTARKKSRA